MKPLLRSSPSTMPDSMDTAVHSAGLSVAGHRLRLQRLADGEGRPADAMRVFIESDAEHEVVVVTGGYKLWAHRPFGFGLAM